MDLTYKRQNVYALADEQELKAISDYAEGYKRFLDNGKTEREAVKETIEMIEKRVISLIRSATKSMPATSFITTIAARACLS